MAFAHKSVENGHSPIVAGDKSASFRDTPEFNSFQELIRKLADKEYAEIDDIREDLGSLKKNLSALGGKLKEDGAEGMGDLKEALSDNFEAIREKTEGGMKALEDSVRAHPRNSVLIAFAAGVVANFLLRR